MTVTWRGIVRLAGAAGALLVLSRGAVEAQEFQAVPGPSNLTATAASPSRIDLSWTRVNTGQVVEYRVYYRDGTLVARVPSTLSTYSDTGLEAWTEYRYYVTGATSTGNESGPSNVATARTLDGTPPTAPGNLAGAAVSSTQISLNWSAANDPESGVDAYAVYRDRSEIGRTSGQTFQDDGLTPDRAYSYEVTAVNGQQIEGPAAGPIQVSTAAEPTPDPPRDLSASPVSASAIDLSWTPPADDGNVVSYRVYRNESPVGSVAGSSYRDEGLASYTTYEYRVTSVGGTGDESGPSDPVSARTLDGSPPSVPGDLTGQAISQTQVSVAWSAATDPQTGITEYVVYRDGSEIARTASLAHGDGGLQAGQVYEYRVSAVNGQGMEGNSAGPIQIQTLSEEPPDAPTGLTATAVDQGSVDLAWDPHPDEDDLAGYRVYRDGAFVAATSEASYRDSGLTAFTTYVYTVTAVSEIGDESLPSEAAMTTTPDLTPPSVPQDLAATPVSAESVSLSWSPSTDDESAIAYYRVFRDGSEIATPAGVEFQDSGLASGTTYEYRVSAVNGQGLESDLSVAASATTLVVEGPEPPTDLTATPISSSQIDLAWTDPGDDATSYRVFRDDSLLGSVIATAFADTGLQPATTYRYSVASLDADGLQGPRSMEISATTPPVEDVTPPAPPTGLRVVSP